MSGLLQVGLVGDPFPILRATLPLVGCIRSVNLLESEMILICAKDETEALRWARAIDPTGPITMALCEASLDDEAIRRLAAAGLWSCAGGRLEPAQLKSLLIGWVELARRVIPLQRENHRLRGLVDRDHLTGLLNMRSFYERLGVEMARAGRYGRPVSVVMMDLDDFKGINDRNDHVFGSYVLSEVGRIVRERTRSVDLCARFGGDEFVIALVETELAGALQFAERLRATLGSHAFREGALETGLTASFGVTTWTAGTSRHQDALELVRGSDQALYEAKESGKNCIRVHLQGPVPGDKVPVHES